MNLILLGLPGAGKGTQAKKISQEYNLPHIATGDIFRLLVEEATPLGEKIKLYLDKGQLVPDEDAIMVLKEELKKIDINEGFVLDGFPRTVYQAKVLKELLAEINTAINMAFYIKVDPEKLVERIAGRRVCLNCGHSYHIKYNPPEKKGICDVCGEELVLRSDDREDTVRKRIQIQLEELNKIADFYQEEKILKIITGNSIEEIYEEIKRAIEGEIG
ncbi:MAG TPA: adenylate kinase [Halanaerobiaceae bacterium]|nr:adenylate kinase [Bacillota bacterium]HHU92623.1 adenylate kinase [Halanaerobiaceae bacterium]HOA40503.1 adenylate kinase [Halanaerobiales bacterium]HPZ62654.1 adenylate kinase [Halanaerobiales bacterium]HQD03516.1 adenylate kinase [Halanaerobiales bacterium]